MAVKSLVHAFKRALCAALSLVAFSGFAFSNTALADPTHTTAIIALFASPTGGAVRGEDAYGSGSFLARRAKGKRLHHGADYIATPGTVINSPIAGTVTQIGYAYRNNKKLRFVTVQNAATGYSSRIMYVDPDVRLGDEINVGSPLGKAQDLKVRYPRGITNHVHVELTDPTGKLVDPEPLLTTQPELQLASHPIVVPLS